MADVPRLLWGIERDDHKVVGASGLVVLAMLWGYVTGQKKVAGGPHFIFHTIERLALMRGVDRRTIDSGLKALRKVTGRTASPQSERCGLVEAGTHEKKTGFWLFTPVGFEDQAVVVAGRVVAPAQQPDDLILGAPPVRRAGDRRSILREIGDRSCGGRDLEPRSILRRGTIDLAGDRRSILQP